MVIGCSHGSYVDRSAEKKAKEFMESWQPKHRGHLGDLWEFTALRKGAGPEERKVGIKVDINAGFELLDWFKPQKLTMGNHDHRLWRAANETESSPTLAELLQTAVMEAEDELRKRRIQWCEWGVDQYLKFDCGGPKLIHGYKSTMYPAKAHFEHWGDCIASHVHKPDSHIARHIDGGVAHTTGALVNFKKLTYADGQAAKLGWRNGWGYGLINRKTGKWQMWHVIKDGKEWVSPHGII